jgi:BMFP domain-containing protein YqiC
MAIKRICTCLEQETLNTIKTHHWKVPELIWLGMKAREGNPQLITRIRELEAINDGLSAKIQTLARRLYELEAGDQANLGSSASGIK